MNDHAEPNVIQKISTGTYNNQTDKYRSPTKQVELLGPNNWPKLQELLKKRTRTAESAQAELVNKLQGPTLRRHAVQNTKSLIKSNTSRQNYQTSIRPPNLKTEVSGKYPKYMTNQ